MKRKIGLVALLSLLGSIALISAGCASIDIQHAAGNLNMASMADMPADVQNAPTTVQEAYRFAAENSGCDDPDPVLLRLRRHGTHLQLRLLCEWRKQRRQSFF